MVQPRNHRFDHFPKTQAPHDDVKYENTTVIISGLGFSVAGTDAEPLPQCAACADVLANDTVT